MNPVNGRLRSEHLCIRALVPVVFPRPLALPHRPQDNIRSVEKDDDLAMFNVALITGPSNRHARMDSLARRAGSIAAQRTLPFGPGAANIAFAG
jgi:hypothetical protein